MSGLTSPSFSFDVNFVKPRRAWLSRSLWLSLLSAVTNALVGGEPLGLVRDVDRLELAELLDDLIRATQLRLGVLADLVVDSWST